MPIDPLPDPRSDRETDPDLEPITNVVLRYGYLRHIGRFDCEPDLPIEPGLRLVTRTNRGVELAETLTTTCNNPTVYVRINGRQLDNYIERSGGRQYPFSTEGRVLRVASAEDLHEQAHLDAHKRDYMQTARQMARELDLGMKLVDVELLLGGDRIIFYFTSESRVDFRELVRRLAGEFHTRIEMRQVGARDEARLVADFEKCGQHCCCRQFLKVLRPVSMKAAKIQKATLDPTKISGRCGRLMCCLRYEEETYEELRRRLPRRNALVQTPEGLARVIHGQVITQLVMVEMESTRARAAYSVEQIELVTEEQAEQIRAAASARVASGDNGGEQGDRRKDRSRSRRTRKPRSKEADTDEAQPTPAEPQGKSPGDGGQAVADNAEADEQAPTKKKKRRRRRRRRSKKTGGGSSDQSSGNGGG